MRSLHAAIHVCCLASLLAAPALQAKAPSNQLVRVPQDAKTLDVALGRVADGGVIEMAAGTYASPSNGFTINNARKGFTVRAAAGARVLIDGGGSRALLRFTNSAFARGKKVTFQTLFFQNGYSAAPGASGGITLSAAEAVFQGCSFVNNRAAAAISGGGAVIVLAGSSATFVNDVFRGNSSPVRGGAIEARTSTVTIQGGSFTANRTNLPGHNPVSYGGAIAIIDATLSITEARFEANQAGWVSGAIFAIGNWDKGSNVLVTRSTFLNNLAVPDPCCANPQPTSGGAIHAEDLTTLRVHDSLFVENQADFGGGVDSYRADVEIDGSVFQRNEAQGGGAVAALSGDNADSSTDNGAINRRSARLVVHHSLLQGGAATAPLGGGCILVNGDTARAYGGGSVAPDGTLDQNRATVEIHNTLFSDCDAEDAAAGGFGGALNGALIALDLEDSMIVDSDARGSGGGGGGVALTQDSNALIVRTTFANDTADKWGGAVFLGGSNLLMDSCRFYGNDIEPGISESLSESRGTAIYSIPRVNPTRPANVSGVVANSAFAGNLGIPVWDVDPTTGPTNEMRYDNDRFEPTRFGSFIYVNTLVRPGGATVADLNALTVSRGTRGSTRKSANPNTPVANLSEGALIDVPSPNSVGAGAPAPTASILGYAWTGRSAAIGNLGTTTQKTGLLEVPPGSYTLTVDQVAAATVTAAGTCTAGPSLCLSGDRFRAEVTWQNGTVATAGQAISLSGDTGYFWFSDPNSVELAVKVLDGRGQNGNFWVFYGGLTNVAYTLTVTDSLTGAVKVYNNLAGRFTSAGDVNAFPAPAGRAAAVAVAEPEPESDLAGKATACDPAGLCLGGSRFAVQVAWTDASGKTNAGHATAISDGSGYFWFTSPADGEVAVKVLDGRGLNGNFWVFYGSLTNLGYTLTVTDTQTGVSRSYVNAPGKFTSRGDTAAFPGS